MTRQVSYHLWALVSSYGDLVSSCGYRRAYLYLSGYRQKNHSRHFKEGPLTMENQFLGD